MLNPSPTAADAVKLHRALVNEREGHRTTRRALAALTERLDALEQQAPSPAPDMATITGALAGIRADLRAELAAVRGELQELAEIVHQFARS